MPNISIELTKAQTQNVDPLDATQGSGATVDTSAVTTAIGDVTTAIAAALLAADDTHDSTPEIEAIETALADVTAAVAALTAGIAGAVALVIDQDVATKADALQALHKFQTILGGGVPGLALPADWALAP